MIFDTGAERSLISLERARSLKLPMLGAVEARGSGEGTMEASLIKEVTFELPGVKVPARSIVSLSLSALDGRHPRLRVARVRDFASDLFDCAGVGPVSGEPLLHYWESKQVQADLPEECA